MPKRIVFCADGTWNGPESETGVSVIDGNDDHGELLKSKVTNVVKLFANLSGRATPDTLTLRDEQEKVLTNPDGSQAQVAKYLHGVGDSDNVLIRVLAGVLGAGIIDRIVRGYTFISRNYAAGDEIHIVGFSRGAYTARALGGMIAKVGLLNPKTYDPANKVDAYRLGIAAWSKSKGVMLTEANKLSGIKGHLLNYVESFLASQLRPDSLIPDVKIKSIGVWDTVGSLGIPAYAGDERYDLFRFINTALSNQVDNGFHAMSIDELRIDFPVTRWDERKGVRQVWFAGAHSDVGGGYPPAECGLSDIGLDWMMKRLAEVGVSFASPLAYDPNAQQLARSVHQPWMDPPFSLTKRSPRQVLAADEVHDTAVQRWKTDSTYRPAALAAWAGAHIS
jgi:uncharacterized protein (DUF2235 family)